MGAIKGDTTSLDNGSSDAACPDSLHSAAVPVIINFATGAATNAAFLSKP